MGSSLKSKKFFAYLVADFGWKILMFYVLMNYKDQINHFALVTLATMIITSGFIQIGYILGQAALDRYTHVASLAIRKGEVPKDEEPK